LETAITALETELQGKASGGGNIETCTVTINYEYNSISQLAYMDVNTGQYNVLYDLNTGNTTIKCVCGSLIYLYMHVSMMGKSFNNLTELFGNSNICVLGIDATNNGIATINLTTSAGGSGGAGGS
jgi:hypothetical protein